MLEEGICDTGEETASCYNYIKVIILNVSINKSKVWCVVFTKKKISLPANCCDCTLSLLTIFSQKHAPIFFLLIMYKLMSFYLLKEWELIHKHCTFIIRLNMHRWAQRHSPFRVCICSCCFASSCLFIFLSKFCFHVSFQERFSISCSPSLQIQHQFSLVSWFFS